MFLQSLIQSFQTSGGATGDLEIMDDPAKKFNHRFSSDGGVQVTAQNAAVENRKSDMDLEILSSGIHALTVGTQRWQLDAFLATRSYKNAKNNELFKTFFEKYSAVKGNAVMRNEYAEFANALAPQEKFFLLTNMRTTVRGLLDRVTHKKTELEKTFPAGILGIFFRIAHYFTLNRYERSISLLSASDESLAATIQSLDPSIQAGQAHIKKLQLLLPLPPEEAGKLLQELGLDPAKNEHFVNALKLKLAENKLTRQNALYQTEADKQVVNALLRELPIPSERVLDAMRIKVANPSEDEEKFLAILKETIFERKITLASLQEDPMVRNTLMVNTLRKLQLTSNRPDLAASVALLQKYVIEENPSNKLLDYSELSSIINQDKEMIDADHQLLQRDYPNLSLRELIFLRNTLCTASKDASRMIPERQQDYLSRRKVNIANRFNSDMLNLIAVREELDDAVVDSFIADRIANVFQSGELLSREQFERYSHEAGEIKRQQPQREAVAS